MWQNAKSQFMRHVNTLEDIRKNWYIQQLNLFSIQITFLQGF